MFHRAFTRSAVGATKEACFRDDSALDEGVLAGVVDRGATFVGSASQTSRLQVHLKFD